MRWIAFPGEYDTVLESVREQYESGTGECYQWKRSQKHPPRMDVTVPRDHIARQNETLLVHTIAVDFRNPQPSPCQLTLKIETTPHQDITLTTPCTNSKNSLAGRSLLSHLSLSSLLYWIVWSIGLSMAMV